MNLNEAIETLLDAAYYRIADLEAIPQHPTQDKERLELRAAIKFAEDDTNTCYDPNEVKIAELEDYITELNDLLWRKDSNYALLQDLYRQSLETRKSLEKERDQLREERRWIPCSERMPEIGVRVLGTKDGHVAIVYSDSGEWVADDGETPVPAPTHWQPLLEPKEGE